MRAPIYSCAEPLLGGHGCGVSGGEGGVILMSYSYPFGHILIFHVIALLVTLVSFEDHASVINCPCSLAPPVKVSPFPLCFSVSGDVNMGF